MTANLDALFDDDDADDPSGKPVGGFQNQSLNIQLKNPVRELADFLSPEACAQLAGFNPSTTRFRVYVELPPDKIPPDDREENLLYGYALLQSAKPLSVAGQSLVRYLRNVGVLGNIAIEWLPNRGGKVVHFLQLEDAAPAQPEPARPNLQSLFSQPQGGENAQSNNQMLLMVMDMMDRQQRESQARIDSLVRDNREQMNELLASIRDNDPMREIGMQMARAGNEAVIESVKQRIGEITGKRSGLSELVEQMEEMESVKQRMAMLGGGGGEEAGGSGLGEITELVTLISSLKGGGNNQALQDVVTKLGGAGDNILNTA